METIPAEELGAGMTIRSDDGDIFLAIVEVIEEVSFTGVNLATGEDVSGAFDRDDEVLWIDQVRGEAAVPVTVAVQAIQRVVEHLRKRPQLGPLVYSEERPNAYFAATQTIAEAIQDAVES